MKILFVSLSLPPFAESQTIRSAYMIEAMAREGIEFDLLTAEVVPSLRDETLNALLPPNLRVWRTPTPTYDRTLQRLYALRSQLPLYLYSNLAYRLFAPDVRRGWDRQAVALAEQIRSEVQPDLLMSASGSCTAHLACAELKKRWNIPWIADLGDPWSWVDWQHLDTWLKALQNRRLERQTLSSVDQMVVTTESTADAYKQSWGSLRNRPLIVPFGYRAEEFPAQPFQPTPSPIQMAYVGSASRRARNLIPLIRALGALRNHPCRFRLQMVGSVSHHFQQEAQRCGFSDLNATGRVSYEASLKAIRTAGILVLVGNISPYQIPGKTFHYLASGRPILYLAQMPQDKDPTYTLLKDFPGARWVPNHQEPIQEFLDSLTPESFHEWECEANTHLQQPELHRYEIRSAVRPLLEGLHRFAGGTYVTHRG